MFQKPSESSFSYEPPSTQDEVETVVGPSVHVEGDFVSEGNIVVKGSVAGSVKTSRQLTVVEGAKILANVKAGTALVSGQIKGNVRVEDRLELTETAQILGDVTCSTLVVAPGALLHGKVTMQGIEIDEGAATKKKSVKVRRAEIEGDSDIEDGAE